MRVITYDLETLSTIEEAGGWDKHDKLGVSVLCAHDSQTDTYIAFSDALPSSRRLAAHKYQEGDIRYSFLRLESFQDFVDSADLMIGFNNIRFDNRVLFHNNILIPTEKCYDILLEGWKAQNLPLDSYSKETHSGGLDDYAKANLGESKTGTGELAPRLWAQGKYEEVIQYCLRDVMLTRKLFSVICDYGWLYNPAIKKQVYFKHYKWPKTLGDMVGVLSVEGLAKFKVEGGSDIASGFG